MRANLLGKLRPPPLVHSWEFWHDRQDRKRERDGNVEKESAPQDKPSSEDYEARLVKLASVTDVRDFWEVFNNFDIAKLEFRDSVHLFHKGVKPVWEDPRNQKGGAWTFRVSKEKAQEFWKAVALMAIGETLQQAVASDRIAFRDDICGISLSIRFTSYLVQIWNRDGNHDQGIQRIFDAVVSELSPDLQPKEGMYFYKKHSDHAGFRAPEGTN